MNGAIRLSILLIVLVACAIAFYLTSDEKPVLPVQTTTATPRPYKFELPPDKALIVEENTTLSGSYYLPGGMVIMPEVVVTVAAGTTMVFEGSRGWIENNGQLHFEGTYEQPITVYRCAGIVKRLGTLDEVECDDFNTIVDYTTIEMTHVNMTIIGAPYECELPLSEIKDKTWENIDQRECPATLQAGSVWMDRCKIDIVGRPGMCFIAATDLSISGSRIEYTECNVYNDRHRNGSFWNPRDNQINPRAKEIYHSSFIEADDISIGSTQFIGMKSPIISANTGGVGNCLFEDIQGSYPYVFCADGQIDFAGCYFNKSRLILYAGTYTRCAFYECDILFCNGMTSSNTMNACVFVKSTLQEELDDYIRIGSGVETRKAEQLKTNINDNVIKSSIIWDCEVADMRYVEYIYSAFIECNNCDDVRGYVRVYTTRAPESLIRSGYVREEVRIEDDYMFYDLERTIKYSTCYDYKDYKSHYNELSSILYDIGKKAKRVISK